MVLFGLGPGRCCERKGCPRSPAQCPWTQELTRFRFKAERRTVSEDGGWENTMLPGGADKSVWFKGQVCGEEKAVGKCGGRGGEEVTQPKSGPGLNPEDRGGPRGKTAWGGRGQDRNLGREGAGHRVTKRKAAQAPPTPRPTQLGGGIESRWDPGAGEGGHLRRPLLLRAQGWLWAASDVRRRPPSGLISSGGEAFSWLAL